MSPERVRVKESSPSSAESSFRELDHVFLQVVSFFFSVSFAHFVLFFISLLFDLFWVSFSFVVGILMLPNCDQNSVSVNYSLF